MLRFLRIRQLAVIDAVEVEFEPGFNVLTGETGAGKSILVEAVGLLLGGRASGDLVRTGEDAATIEAIFESGGEDLPRSPGNHRPGSQPRVHQRRAGHGGALKNLVVALDRAPRPARTLHAARSLHPPGRHSTSLVRSIAHRHPSGAFDAWSAADDLATPAAAVDRERPGSDHISVGGAGSGGTQSRRRRGAGCDATGVRECRAG